MLGNKHWMPAHRCLFAVIWDDRRRKPHSDEVGRMMLNGFHALAHYVLPVLFTQMEPVSYTQLTLPTILRV